MTEVMEQMDIKNVLNSLGIKSQNSGSAVGAHWFMTRGEKISSYSPVDGNLIADVNAATNMEYKESLVQVELKIDLNKLWH